MSQYSVGKGYYIKARRNSEVKNKSIIIMKKKESNYKVCSKFEPLY